MNDDMNPADGERRPRSWARTATLLGGGVIAGAVLAGVATANAATTTPSPSSTSGTSSSSSSTSGAASGSSSSSTPKGFNPVGSTPVRSDEKEVTGTLATTLKEKALAKVPGGTVIRVETDAGDAAYEVHMKKSDGSLVTVKFDKNGDVTAVEDGMGKGDPAPSGGKGAPPSGGNGGPSSGSSNGTPPSGAPSSGSSSTTTG